MVSLSSFSFTQRRERQFHTSAILSSSPLFFLFFLFVEQKKKKKQDVKKSNQQKMNTVLSGAIENILTKLTFRLLQFCHKNLRHVLFLFLCHIEIILSFKCCHYLVKKYIHTNTIQIMTIFRDSNRIHSNIV